METIKQLNEYGEFVGNIFLGRFYTFKYKAMKERFKENPYFDRYPTVIVTHRHDAMTFDGINFNYIDTERRSILLELLKPFFQVRNQRPFFEWREYKEISHLKKYKFARVCMRRYRIKGCYAGIVRVNDGMWSDTIMERNERFFTTDTLKPIKSENVWLDSLRKSRMIK